MRKSEGTSQQTGHIWAAPLWSPLAPRQEVLVIVPKATVNLKYFLGLPSDSVRYPSRQCQILDFAQVVAFWRDGRYCNARGGKKTVDKPWRTVEFQARVKILGPLENWLATASYDAPADVGSGEACATVDQVVLAGRATNQ